MKTRIVLALTFIFLMIANIAFAQEWKNLKSYRKETRNPYLNEGSWLKKDRKKQNDVWKKANLFNLSLENGNTKYKTIDQIRDFYIWFDMEREKKGHEIKWFGIAGIVAGRLSKLDNSFIRFFVIRDREAVNFANEGSKKVFEFAFPQLKKIYFSSETIKGKYAENWDLEYGMNEQCLILDSLYKKLSSRTLHRLERMAKGEGIFGLGVSKKMRYEGDISNCQTRFEHGINKILPFYVSNSKYRSTNQVIKSSGN